MSSSSKGYQFTISGGTVAAVYEMEHGRTKLERMDDGESWVFDGTSVIKTEWDDGRLETSTYSDIDGDGLFFRASKIYSPSTASGLNYVVDYSNQGINTPALSGVGYSENGYQFDIDASGVVTAVYEVKHGRLKAERMDWNEDWTFDGLDITKVETKFGKVETSVYTDTNQDGIFQKDFGLDVLNGVNQRSLELYKFSLAGGVVATGDLVIEGDAITGMMELGRRGWRADRIDANETIQVVEVGTDNLILQAKQQWNGKIDFSVFRDDDSDGLWTEIANGETLELFVTLDGQVDLVGIADAGLLQAADALFA